MKRKVSILLAILMLLALMIPSAYGQTNIKVTLDGKPVSFDVQPFIENGRTLVPFRAIFEALGATVDWDETTKTVSGVKGSTKIILKVNSTKASANGKETMLDVPAKVKNGRTFVPTRFIAENLGVRVYWDSLASTVVLLSDAIDPQDDSKYISKPKELSPSTKGKIDVWHFYKDDALRIENDFKMNFPNIAINMKVIPDKDDQFSNKLAAAVKAGSGVPDVAYVESAFTRKFIEMPNCFHDITDKVGDITENMYRYTVDYGKDTKGRIKALSYHIYPGAIGYKRQVAKKYLGTDDPAKISEMISTSDKILQTAKKLKEKSEGKVCLFPSWEELFGINVGGRSKCWVVDGKLTIDQKVTDFIDIAKTFRENKYESGFDAWSSGWASCIGSEEVAMCWYIPPWGVPWIITSNDRNAKDGDRWGLAKPEYSYFWGGTWLGVLQGSKNKDTALGFVRFMVSNKEHMIEWNKNTGEIPNNKGVVNQFSSDNRKDPVTGQNLFKVYGDIAEGVNGKSGSQYDDGMYYTFSTSMKLYLANKISSKEEMLEDFKERVKTEYPDVKVD